MYKKVGLGKSEISKTKTSCEASVGNSAASIAKNIIINVLLLD
jgi:hypothetical protein